MLSGLPAPALLIVGRVARSQVETITTDLWKQLPEPTEAERTTYRVMRKGEPSIEEQRREESWLGEALQACRLDTWAVAIALAAGTAGAGRRAEAHPLVTREVRTENRGDAHG